MMLIRSEELIRELSVCIDCMIVHANGEMPTDRPTEEPEPWAEIGFGYTVTMGGEHREGCPNRDRVSMIEDCDCGDLGFSWQSCDGCGSSLGGDRYRFTLWAATEDYARQQCRTAIDSARFLYRPVGRRTDSIGALTAAAQWRMYLAERIAIRHRFERWADANGITL